MSKPRLTTKTIDPTQALLKKLDISGKPGVDFEIFMNNNKDDAGSSCEILFFSEKRADEERKRLPCFFEGKRLIISYHSVPLNINKELDAISPQEISDFGY